MKIKVLLFALALIPIAPSVFSQEHAKSEQREGHAPAEGYVPDAVTAVKIAEAVLVPVYGEQKTLSERPFKAELKGGVWTVGGTLYCADGKVGMCLGGTATVKISKNDGHILFMIHYK